MLVIGTNAQSRLTNISTRAEVGTGANVLIGGFVISGSESKTVLIRAIGPSLANSGVRGELADPTISLFSGSTNIDANDDWQDHERAAEIPQQLRPENNLESAMLVTLGPGAYTSVIRGFNGSTGVALIEVYEITVDATAELINISTRGRVGTRDSVMIGGFVITGSEPMTVAIRGLGRTLEQAGVAGVLQDLSIKLFAGSGPIDENDNWRDYKFADFVPEALAPDFDNEAVMIRTLEPGPYTIIVRGNGSTEGVAIIEVYEAELSNSEELDENGTIGIEPINALLQDGADIAVETGPSNGSVELTETGYEYSADQGFTGIDSFSFLVQVDGASLRRSVFINVGTKEITAFDVGFFAPREELANFCANPRPGIDSAGSFVDENYWIRSFSNETYLWYRDLPNVDPALVPDSELYFAFMQSFETAPSGELIDNFHFTLSTDAYRQQVESGISASYGANYIFPPDGTIVLTSVEPNSPADNAGFTRGTTILGADDIVLSSALSLEQITAINAALFPEALNETHSFLIRDLGATANRTVNLTSAQVTSVPVPLVKSISTPSGNVGYILFNSHIVSAEPQLVAAVEQLNTANLSDIVLDLRYNSGGLGEVANNLSYMLAGSNASTQIFYELEFNDKIVIDPFTRQPPAPTPFNSTTTGNLSLPAGTSLPPLQRTRSRIFIITGQDTCSASELIINALAGIDREVILIGDTTCGKPFGFIPEDNCGTTYFTIQIKTVNAKGFGDYTQGFSPVPGLTEVNGASVPGCLVEDDYSHALGDPDEARLAAALNYIETGQCPSTVTTSSLRAPKTAQPNQSLDNVLSKPKLLQNMIMTQ